MSFWACRSCGADNMPEHCMGDADYPGEFDEVSGMIERPRCDIGPDGGVCICACDECNPQTCRVCGDDL